MPNGKMLPLDSPLRALPSVDEILRTDAARAIAAEAGEPHTADIARSILERIRAAQAAGASSATRTTLLSAAETELEHAWRIEKLGSISRVLNLTGVVIHTNLGRAPLSDNVTRALGDIAGGYCTLEYDLVEGKRGPRGRRAEKMLEDLTGAESVLIVNNCAAAAFFVLTVFAGGGEVIVSRGELVEIGGDFRVPDVLTQSGAALCEIGTTNRTKLADYDRSIGDRTRLILRVHPSNYRIVGFTGTPTLTELADLAHSRGLLLYEDLGSGALVGLPALAGEPVVGRSIECGVDIVTFSGDKLLGGPQAGIIAGKRQLIDTLRKHPLYRALRVDKLTYAALEVTMNSYSRGVAGQEIPVLRMLSLTKDEIAERAAKLKSRFETFGERTDLGLELIDGISATGGGAAPGVEIETMLICLSHRRLSATKLEQRLRAAEPPVIARIVDKRVVLDLRTLAPDDDDELLNILRNI